jgi:hypothetical protein
MGTLTVVAAFICVGRLWADDNSSGSAAASSPTFLSTKQPSIPSDINGKRNNMASNSSLVFQYTETLAVSDERQGQLRDLAKSSIEDFATQLTKIPKLNALFAEQLAKPEIKEYINGPNEFLYVLLMDHGVKTVPTEKVPGSLASALSGPSYPDGSCRINLTIGTEGSRMTSSAVYHLPLMRLLHINYYFKIQPSDPALEKTVDELYLQTVLTYCLKAGMSQDDIKKFMPGLLPD